MISDKTNKNKITKRPKTQRNYTTNQQTVYKSTTAKFYCFFVAASELFRVALFTGTLDEPATCFDPAPVSFFRPNNEPTLLYRCPFSGVVATEEPTTDDDGLSEHDTVDTPPPSIASIFRSRLLAGRRAEYDSPFLRLRKALNNSRYRATNDS